MVLMSHIHTHTHCHIYVLKLSFFFAFSFSTNFHNGKLFMKNVTSISIGREGIYMNRNVSGGDGILRDDKRL